MSSSDRTVVLRIVVVDPPAGVAVALQRGKGELAQRTVADGSTLSFEAAVRARSGGDGPNFLGDVAQGPRGARFVYLTWGTSAGQPGSCWTRRTKVPLSGITWDLVDRADAPAHVLEARIAGTGRDGGPACATVPLLGDGWRIAAGTAGASHD